MIMTLMVLIIMIIVEIMMMMMEVVAGHEVAVILTLLTVQTGGCWRSGKARELPEL